MKSNLKKEFYQIIQEVLDGFELERTELAVVSVEVEEGISIIEVADEVPQDRGLGLGKEITLQAQVPESPAIPPIVVQKIGGSSTPTHIDNPPAPQFLKLPIPLLRLTLPPLHPLLNSF